MLTGFVFNSFNGSSLRREAELLAIIMDSQRAFHADR